MDPPLVFMNMAQDAIKLPAVEVNMRGLELQSLLVLIAIHMHTLYLNKVFLRRGIFQITCHIWNRCFQQTRLDLWKSVQAPQALPLQDRKEQWREASK